MKTLDKKILKLKVLDLLKSNIDAGYIKSSQIIRSIPQVKTGRALRDIINSLRQESEPIISSNDGYYYSNDKTDVELYVKSLKQRIDSITKAYKGLNRWLDEYEEPRIDDFWLK